MFARNFKINLSIYLTIAFAFLLLFPIDFPFRHTHHHARYHEDDHDVCRSSGWLFGILLVWYFVMLLILLSQKRIIQNEWAQRLILYPNFVVSIIGLLGISYLLYSYNTHSEEGFVTTMGILNGCVLLTIVLFNKTISDNPLKGGMIYAWNILFYPPAFFLTLFFGLSLYEKQWYTGGITFLIVVPHIWGYMDVKKDANKYSANVFGL